MVIFFVDINKFNGIKVLGGFAE